MKHQKILKFLQELKSADATIPRIFLEGSCFRLYRILEVLFPEAEPLYSDRDGHWITKIDEEYYDINGRLSYGYVRDKEYTFRGEVNKASAYVHTHSNNLGTPYEKYIETV